MVAAPISVDTGQRLEILARRAQGLELDGLPFPTAQIRSTVEAALQAGRADQAEAVLRRGELLVEQISRDWGWARELLGREDELRRLATQIGMDVQPLDRRLGNARARLREGPLTGGAIQRAAAIGSAALAVLNDTIPKFCVQEAKKLGASIQAARDRGEDVTDATTRFRALLTAVHEQHPARMAEKLVDARRAVVRIPRAPSIASFPGTSEEEEILNEARNLARRLHRIRSQARNVQSAARLMSQVRSVLSEERRYGTPEEEIEALWTEVDRITRERRQASEDEGIDATEPDGDPPLTDEPFDEEPVPPPARSRSPR